MKPAPGKPIARHALVAAVPHQISSDLGGEVVVLDLKAGVYLGLEGVGARVWELLSERRTVGEIEGILLREYDVEPERCGRDLNALLHGLVEKGVVEVTHGRPR